MAALLDDLTSETGAKLYVSNLDYGVNNEDIKELFSQVGELKRFSIHYDTTGRSKGTAEVVFSRCPDALAAVKRYNNVQLDGKPMKLEIVGTNLSTPVPLVPNGRNGNSNDFPIRTMGAHEMERVDGRTVNQLRPLACSRNVLNRAHGSARWSQGDTVVLAAVYGPKAGTRKGENPEKASIEVIWKPKSGQIGKPEREYEMILKRTLQSICLLTIHPNTTTSVILQVVGDDGALLPCAINASCAALVDAGIPLKYLAAAICCGLTTTGSVILDPTKVEEKKMQAFVYLVFPNSPLSVLPNGQSPDEEPTEHGIITSVTHGMMSELDYFSCLDRGRAACAKISEFLRRSLQSQVPDDGTKST